MAEPTYSCDYLLNLKKGIAEKLFFQPFLRPDLVEEAIVAAHRCRETDYASDGNRQLSATGRAAVTSCVKLYSRGGDPLTIEAWRPEYTECWNRLLSKEVCLKIASDSDLHLCIVSSFRQTNHVAQQALSKTVMSHLCLAMIGAAFIGHNGDLARTSYTIHKMARLLDHPLNEVAGSSQGSSVTAVDRGQWGATSSNSPDYMSPMDSSTAIDWSGFEESLECRLPSYTDGMLSHLDSNGSPQHVSSMDRRSSPSENNFYHDLDEATHLLKKISLAHTSDAKQMSLVKVKPEILAPQAPSRNESDTHQQSPPSRAENVAPVPLVRSSTRMTQGSSTSSTAQNTTQVRLQLPIGSISPGQILLIREYLASAPDQAMQLDAESYATPVQLHYKEYQRLTTHAGGPLVLYNAYQFYLLIRGPVEEGQNEDNIQYDRFKPVIRGNPRTGALSAELQRTRYAIKPNYDNLDEKDQQEFDREFNKIRQLGLRLYEFVRIFGLGVLCFLPISHSASRSSVLSVSRFSKLPRKDIKSFATSLRTQNTTFSSFSRAADPLIKYMVDASSISFGIFRFQNTSRDVIEAMEPNSEELLRQLDRLDGEEEYDML